MCASLSGLWRETVPSPCKHFTCSRPLSGHQRSKASSLQPADLHIFPPREVGVGLRDPGLLQPNTLLVPCPSQDTTPQHAIYMYTALCVCQGRARRRGGGVFNILAPPPTSLKCVVPIPVVDLPYLTMSKVTPGPAPCKVTYDCPVLFFLGAWLTLVSTHLNDLCMPLLSLALPWPRQVSMVLPDPGCGVRVLLLSSV